MGQWNNDPSISYIAYIRSEVFANPYGIFVYNELMTLDVSLKLKKLCRIYKRQCILYNSSIFLSHRYFLSYYFILQNLCQICVQTEWKKEPKKLRFVFNFNVRNQSFFHNFLDYRKIYIFRNRKIDKIKFSSWKLWLGNSY